MPCPAGTDHHQACPCKGRCGQGWRTHCHQLQGLFCIWILSQWEIMTTNNAPSLQSSLAVKASSTQANILPLNWKMMGAAAAALLCYSALSSECNYLKHGVIRHYLQSLQLFGIPVYWLTDRFCRRMQQIEHSNYRFTLRGRFKS